MKNTVLWIKRLLPFGGILVFVMLLFYIGIEEIVEAVHSVSLLYLGAALVLIGPMMLIRGYAWQLVLREQNIPLRFVHVVKILFMGYFYGMLTPGYVGQVARVLYVKDYTDERSGKIFVNVVIETLLRTFSLYIVMIVGAFVLLSYFPHLFLLAILWVGVMVVVVVFFLSRRRGELLVQWLVLHLAPKGLKPFFSRFTDSFYQDFPQIRRLFLPFVLGAFSWVIVFSQEYLFVLALDLAIPYGLFLLLFPIANIAGYLPITVGGLGTRELTAIIIFTTLFSVSESAIFVVSMLGFFVTDICIGLVGFVFALTETRVGLVKRSFL